VPLRSHRSEAEGVAHADGRLCLSGEWAIRLFTSPAAAAAAHDDAAAEGCSAPPVCAPSAAQRQDGWRPIRVPSNWQACASRRMPPH
jgi:hypothetical protein